MNISESMTLNFELALMGACYNQIQSLWFNAYTSGMSETQKYNLKQRLTD